MPLGLDTPSTFGMVFFVLGPAFLQAKEQMSVENAALYTWHVGICAIFVSGLFKTACAFGANWVRRVVPRAGLLGSLTAVALVLISFLPLIEILHYPVVGFLALAIVLTTLVARIRVPGRIPGALAATLVAGTVYYLMVGFNVIQHDWDQFEQARQGLLPYEWLSVFRFEWVAVLPDSLQYLPIVIPFALGTVIGGIDCTESAAAAGDDFDTRQVIGVEAFATIVASLCGGVIQTTPYIGHPAYKAMGGRAAYTLATALFVGGAGLFGYFGYLYAIIPKATVFPILVFVGLEITAQSFQATAKRHYTAIVLACVPALAALALIFIDKIFGELRAQGIAIESLSESLQIELHTVRILASGFIVTSLLWGSGLAAIIDRRLNVGAVYFGIAAVCSFFGIIHSPLPGSPMFLPWDLDAASLETPLQFGGGYLLTAVLLLGWHRWCQQTGEAAFSDEETPHLGLLHRILEPEVMDTPEEARDYNEMDHSEVNRVFVNDLLACGEIAGDILDLGTGTALIPVELCSRVDTCRVMASDMSVSMLDLAVYNLAVSPAEGRIQLDQADAKQLHYADEQFDIVMSNSIVHHVPEPVAVLREALRVVKPGGLFFFRDLMRPANAEILGHLVATYAAGANEHQRKMFADSLRAALSLDEIRTLVSSLGFHDNTVQATSDRHWTWVARKPD
ncbi:MAG TPA: methyltransferase domain-containing protein [Pirellulaceae bacterium]|nr:methyltransferase domain-containing protein [Pirellulaceae bacterium]